MKDDELRKVLEKFPMLGCGICSSHGCDYCHKYIDLALARIREITKVRVPEKWLDPTDIKRLPKNLKVDASAQNYMWGYNDAISEVLRMNEREG